MPKESSAVEQAERLQRLSGKRAFGEGGASNGGRLINRNSKSDQIRPRLAVQEAGPAQPYLYICGGPPQGLLKSRVVL